MDSCFASAARRSPEEVEIQRRMIEAHPAADLLLAAPSLTLVLNAERQIVFASRHALETLGCSLEDALGKRPGEALGCVHAQQSPGGCGTTEFCAECGAVNAILSGLLGTKTSRECRITRTVDDVMGCLDLRVAATPLRLGGQAFTLLALQDLSHEKRRRALERIFFHDILNSAGGLKGLMGFMKEEAPPELEADAGRIHESFVRLLDAIVAQKDLLAAENDELETCRQILTPQELLQFLARTHLARPEGQGKSVEICSRVDMPPLATDFALLKRVLSAMLQNALEATDVDGRVVLSCAPAPFGRDAAARPGVEFAVTNPGALPREAAQSIFHRAFSTKGEGRGLGCWMMKLLTERYLGGTVGFDSTEAETTFRIRLPLDLCAQE